MLRSAAKGAARRAVTDLSQYPKPGEKLHGFTLLRTKQVPELNLTALHLQHDKTGAEHLHIARDDGNNVFSIGFKTNPPDDTGVPHILEHTTLCGSEKYPIRDPFFKMLPRTLSNFMNAFTAGDHTFYPFATTNDQDFKNLMSVYLDATLHPLLKQSDFTQEGWRIGPEKTEPSAAVEGKAEEAEKLVFKGVVYNEMKGQMSDAGYLFYIRFQDHIFPDLNNSGGDPQKITDLTYDQLKKFHAEHYHPSNAKLFTYGDMPLADHLREIDARLGAFKKIQSDQKVLRPIDLSSGPREVILKGPIDPLVDANKQFKTSVSWVLGDTTDIVESFSLGLLADLLTSGYGSPLYKGLIETGLGTDWSVNTGLDTSGRLGIMSIGLTGVEEVDVPKVKTEIQRLLRAARDKGFEQSKIDGYRHQLELTLKHKTANFGQNLLERVKPKWFNGVDPFDTLAWNDTIAAFEAKLEKGGYLEGLIDKYLLNDNTLTFTMAPSTSFSQDLAKEEEDRLANKISEAVEAAGGADQVYSNFRAQELDLAAEQGKSLQENLDCLPTVHIQDIPRQKERLVIRDEVMNNTKVQWHEAPTNGLTYFRALNPLENLPNELRGLIPLFTDSIMRLGTKDLTTEQLEDLIKVKTGGLSVGYQSLPSPTDFTQGTEGLSFSGVALDQNVPVMLDLLHRVLRDTDFSSPAAVGQIRELLRAGADGAINSIASRGHSFALSTATAGLTRSAYQKEQVGGLSQVKLVTSLANRPESDQLEDVIENLKKIQEIALVGKIRASITCGSESVAANSSALSEFMSSLPARSINFPQRQAPDLARNLKTFYPLPYQVYYGALALPTVSYTSPQSAPLQILSQLLTHRHLHHEIREKGGAYGGAAFCNNLAGMLGFFSYRDPNPLNTINIMRNAGRWAVDKVWTDRDLEEAKISVFKDLDAPSDLSDKSLGRFLYGVDEDMKQTRREQLLDVTKDQVREAAQHYIVDGLARESERVVFLGEKRDWVDQSWKVQDLDISGPE